MSNNAKICFFGGEPLGVPALEALKKASILPDLIVCSPNRKAGRGMQMIEPPVKIWAVANNIEVIQPESYKDKETLSRITDVAWDLFVVVAYNFILPKWVIEIPRKGVVNLHPSLLPKLRGASPIRTAILENKPEDIGVTIMLMDEKMDHGPILDQKIWTTQTWPLAGIALDDELSQLGGMLLAKTIPAWLNDEIEPQAQDHAAATYTKRFVKGENELPINPSRLPTGDEARTLLHKILAWDGIGDTYFIHHGKRIKVKAAKLSASGQLEILRVIPEGKREMSYESFLQVLATK